MNVRRIEVGPLIVVLGGVLLLVSLFLDWFEPGYTAWQVYEVVDLLLAALGILAVVAAVGAMGASAPPVDPRWLGVSAVASLVLVLASLLNHPPAAAGADVEVGLWLALVASVLLCAGALLSTARVRVSLDVQARRTRVAAVDARRASADAADPDGADAPPAQQREETEPPESKL